MVSFTYKKRPGSANSRTSDTITSDWNTVTALFESTRTAYLFDKDLAARIIFAEINHFAAEASLHGPTEDELQTLTRRLAWLTDTDLKWCDVDGLVSYARELRTIHNGTHPLLTVNNAGTVDNTAHLRDSLLLTMFWETNLTLGTVKARWELS